MPRDMKSTPVIFQYRADWCTDGRDEPVVAEADRSWVEKYIPKEEFPELFGGYVTWRVPESPTDEMPGEAIGVWGRRKVSRFRRILREREADYNVEEDHGPNQTLMEQAVYNDEA